MKQLTLTQPWATLVAIGAKRIETRSWRTDYRGPLAIHAAKTLNGIHRGANARDLAAVCAEEPFASALADYRVETTSIGMFEQEYLWNLPIGQIIAVCDLVDVVPTDETLGSSSLSMISAQERAFGNYDHGRYGWLLDNVRPLPQPIEARGYQSLVDVDRQTARAIRQQLETVEAAT